MNLENKIKLHNKFEVKVLDLDGNVKSEQVAYNIVLDTIYAKLLAWMPFFQGIAFGTGSGVPAASDVALFTYLGWRQMGQTDCGTLEEKRNFPVFSRKRRITLRADEFVGQTITEVGIAYSSSTNTSGDGTTTYGGTVTHAMLAVPIPKTALDVVQIDATMYLDLGDYLMADYGDKVYWIGDNPIVDYFFGAVFPSCQWYLSSGRIRDNVVNVNQLGVSAAIARTSWVADALNKKLTTPVTRFDVSAGNGAVRGIGFGSASNKGVFGSLMPIPDVFEEYQITAEAVGTGNGVATGFDLDWNGFIAGSEEIFVDGVKQTIGFAVEDDRVQNLFSKKTPLSALPNQGYGCAFSPDGSYLAAAHDVSPYITVYKREGDTFTKLPALSALPGTGRGCAFSHDGSYLAAAHNGSPYITVYKREGDIFTKLPALSALPGQGYGCAFSHDGSYLAAAYDTSPYITVYQREGDDTFTKLPALSALPSHGYGCAFSPDGSYLAAAYGGSPYITVYKREGDDTFTKLSALSALPGQGYGCAFSHDGSYLAAAHYGSPYITVYKCEGDDTFTKLPALSALPSYGLGCAFSHDGSYLAAAHFGSPYITVYKREDDTFTKLPALSALSGNGRGCAFSPDGSYLAAAHDVSPYITVYQYDSYIPSQSNNIVFATPPGLVTGEAVGTGNGTETNFALDHEPITGSLTVYLNGVATSAYTLAGSTVTFTAAPALGDVITADYKYSCTISANYKVPYIPKDANHVLDLQCSIVWGAE